MDLTRERLDDIEQNGYHLDFSNVMNQAFENYKKIALYAGLVIFVFTFLFLFLILGASASFISFSDMINEFNPEKFEIEKISNSQIWVFNGIKHLLMLLLCPFQAAFLKMADCAEKDEEFHLSTLFNYYRFPYLKEIITTSFLIYLIIFLQKTFFLFFNSDLNILSSLISYFISFISLLIIPLIIFGNLKAIEAIKYSIMIMLKQPIILIGLLIVSIIISFVGFIGCCIGIFFTIPFLYSMNYTIYSTIVGIDSDNKTSEFDSVS